MIKGTQVKLSETSLYYKEDDRHNPKDTIGVVKEYQSSSRIIVDWGGFTNSYSQKDLEII
jgi:hypothetical protein